MSQEKILSLVDLAQKSAQIRKEGKRIVLCHGTFDLMHTGHIRYLKSAREKGDVLFVTVTADAFVNKGPGRPVFPQELRAENLSSLACVDFVSINHAPTAVNVISELKPHAYSKGNDYKNLDEDVTGNIHLEKKAVEEGGGEIIFTDEITFSSTELLNDHFGVFPNETKQYLQKFSKKYNDAKIIEMLNSLKPLKVLVVGDTIIDEYHFTTPLGNSAKGNHLSVQYNYRERFLGGSLAITNHVSGFVEKVKIVSGLGREKESEEFIRANLPKNISPEFYYFVDAPTVVKQRFVDSDLNKLFEVYMYDENPKLENSGEDICNWLDQNVEDFDVVIVSDFGNGFITPEMIEPICNRSRYLAVNTQINSGNRGYHAITRYPRADFVSLNEPEARLATHNRRDSIEHLAQNLAAQLSVKHFAVTRGTKGVMLLDNEGGKTYTVPALSTKVLDRVGAGDAFLAFSAMCLGKGISPEAAVFVGSAAAALDVQIVCNKKPISSGDLLKYLGTLLK
jgi:rfaE bifunctional protein kinase chain/domain/rfaE bifunctional protein nucleotidyltransferase chain/domain